MKIKLKQVESEPVRVMVRVQEVKNEPIAMMVRVQEVPSPDYRAMAKRAKVERVIFQNGKLIRLKK
jgi:hypothetical protein